MVCIDNWQGMGVIWKRMKTISQQRIRKVFAGDRTKAISPLLQLEFDFVESKVGSEAFKSEVLRDQRRKLSSKTVPDCQPSPARS